jgi:hypothetical protein
MSRTPSQPEIAISLPEKPALEGLEAKWMARWEAGGVYRFDRTAQRGEVYSIDTPPPTVSGSLHVGHVFSYTHTDILARYHRMRGRAVFYPMGWDDNGLPTERRVQNYFGVRCDPSLPYDPSFQPPDPSSASGSPRAGSRGDKLRVASGAKAPFVLRASRGLDRWCALQDPGYRRAGPPAAGVGGAGAPGLLEPPRYFDPDR